MNPELSSSEVSAREALERGREDETAYQKALADVLKRLTCSGDESARYFVHRITKAEAEAVDEIGSVGSIFTRITDAGPFAPGLIESILSPDCPVSAALTEQDKADLKKLANPENESNNTRSH